MTTRTALSRTVTLSPNRRQRTTGDYSGSPPSNALVPFGPPGGISGGGGGGGSGGGGGGFFGGGGGGPLIPAPAPNNRQVTCSTTSQLNSALTKDLLSQDGHGCSPRRNGAASRLHGST